MVSEAARKLRELRERAGLSRQALADLIEMPEPSYRHYEVRYKRDTLPYPLAQLIADALSARGIPKAEVLALAGPAMLLGPEGTPDPATEFSHLGPRWPKKASSGDADLPVFAAYEDEESDDGAWILSDYAVDHVGRPDPLERARDGFALYVVGDAMEPAFRQGDIVLVHPGAPPTRGDDVLLVRNDAEDGLERVLLRQLITWSSGTWTVRRHSPERTNVEFSRTEWRKAMLIVGKFSARR